MFPATSAELIEAVARETARMSYPGSMSRGMKPVVHAGTKAALEHYYVNRFPLRDVWSCAGELASSYDTWHQQRTNEMANAIRRYVPRYNVPQAVAAKFLNTFMHQLMKYDVYRTLLPSLHLPLDARVFAALRSMDAVSLRSVQSELASSPYTLRYRSYLQIQRALLALVDELNRRPGVEFKIGSRIELNWLWV